MYMQVIIHDPSLHVQRGARVTRLVPSSLHPKRATKKIPRARNQHPPPPHLSTQHIGNMGKKRRSSTKAAPSGPREVKAKDAKLPAINSWEDVADEEDTFQLGRDKVMLNTELNARTRKVEDSEEEEAMDLKNYGYDSQASSEEEEDDEEEEEGSEDDEDAEEQAASDSESDASDKEEEVEEGWGTSKRAYYGGDEEEADAAAEEAEARRIQAQQLAAMDAQDFGFDEDEWSAPAPTTSTTAPKVIKEILPTTLPESAEERTKLLFTRHPEFQPLMTEFLSLQEIFPALEMSAKAIETVGETEKTSPVVRKWKVASAYLGVLSMYFAVLSNAAKDLAGGVEAVRDHPVMEALLGVRMAWEQVKNERLERIEARLEHTVEKKRKRTSASPTPSVTDSAASASDSESASDSDSEAAPQKRTKKSKTAAQDFSDLASLTFTASSKPKARKTAKPSSAPDADHIEATTLSSIDAAEKASRKKDLRFYTSQIVSKSSKRNLASRNAGGDADIPHRERRKERELRLQAETAKKRAAGFGADLDEGGDDEPAPKKSAAPEDDLDNEYYNLLAKTQKGRKVEGKELHEAKKAARREGVELEVMEGERGIDGKRAIGWTISKNKGLTPHRKKDVRNPRVKKRNAYEKKKIKLGSVKQVYKGGLNGTYGGEMTGIKKNLVKSVKFA